MSSSFRYPPLDSIIVADTFKERGEEVSELIESLQSSPKVFLHLFDNYCCEDPQETEEINSKASADLEKCISSQLEERKQLLLIMNCISAVRFQVLSTTLTIEESLQRRSRKLLLTCISSRQIRKGFKKRELPYQNTFLHIPYDEEGLYLQKITDLVCSRY